MATPELIPEVAREARDRLRRLYGSRLQHVVLYGSCARGEAGEGSDIDLLVVLDDFDDVEAELRRIAPIENELSLEHDVVVCSLVIRAEDYLRGGSPLLMNVRREGIPI